MATPESKVKARVKRILADLNAYYVMPMGTGFGNSGAPDFLVCYRAKFIGIECKAGGNKPTALQYKNLKDIQDCGGVALVVDETNISQLHEVLRRIDDAI
jgi:pantoate kinase